jgi:hypothetical protein
MIADMHRARHLAWELPKLGWDVEILAPDASYQQACYLDKDSAAFFPRGTKLNFAPAFLPGLFRKLGFGSIGWRAIIPMWRAGRRVLKDGAFDLVYFSTTQFPLFLLGPLWRRELGIPYVLDFHDPCAKEDASRPVWMQFNLKYPITRWLLGHIEAITARRTAGLVSVSPQYLDLLSRRYARTKPAWTAPGRTAVIPFAALDEDLAEARKSIQSEGALRPRLSRIVYVGVGGAIMHRSFSLVCQGLAHLKTTRPELLEHVAIDLFGTVFGWEEGGRKDLADIAEQWGLGNLVREYPGRVSYGRSLRLLLEADGALILGVDDAGYIPSKLMSYALSGKPLLAALRQDGPAFEFFQSYPTLGQAIWFDTSGNMPIGAAAGIVAMFLEQVADRRNIDRLAFLRPYLAPAMARRHADLFDKCLTK